MLFYADLARQFREEARLTQEEVGKALGVSSQAVGFWERGENKPLPGNVRRLAKLYGCIVSDISDIAPSPGEDQRVCAESGSQHNVVATCRVPIYGLCMAKGITDWHADVIPEGEYELDTTEAPSDGRRYAAFKVEGDSMEPRIHDGDIVLADLDLEPASGNIVVAKWDDTVMIKRYRRYGNQIVLESINPRYEPIQVRPIWMLRVKRIMSEV